MHVVVLLLGATVLLFPRNVQRARHSFLSFCLHFKLIDVFCFYVLLAVQQNRDESEMPRGGRRDRSRITQSERAVVPNYGSCDNENVRAAAALLGQPL